MESDLKNDPSLSSKSKKELEDNIIACKKYVDQVFNTKDDSVRDSIIKFYYNILFSCYYNIPNIVTL